MNTHKVYRIMPYGKHLLFESSDIDEIFLELKRKDEKEIYPFRGIEIIEIEGPKGSLGMLFSGIKRSKSHDQ